MTDTVIPLYAPRPEQARLHQSLRRFNVLVAHRRFGKTVFCINETLRAAATCQRRDPRFAYVAPLYRQAKDVAWEYLKRYAKPIPGTRINESELRVDLANGARIRLYGAENPDSLRGIYFDGVVMDEYAQMSPRAWTEIISPALADRQGWAIFIGTPKGRNAFCDLYETYRDRMASGNPDTFAVIRRASETGILPEAELARAKADMTPEEYEQEFECSFQAALLGAYWGRDMAAAEAEGRIGAVPHDPRYPVHTAWDLGIGDATAIWMAQTIGREIRLVDFLQASGVGLDWYVRELQRRNYVWGDHLLPHDAQAQELGTGRTRIEILQSLGVKARIVPAHRVDDGIAAVRALLPRCYFDAVKTRDGIEALRQYSREWNEVLQVFKPRPRHDRWSHAADAFRYLALGLDEPEERRHREGVWMARAGNEAYDPLKW